MNVKQNIESEPRLRAYYHASRHKQSDPASIKSQVIRLRVTEAEAQLFKTNATAAGCKSISEYIRSRCIGEATVDTTTATAQDTPKKKQAKSSKK